MADAIKIYNKVAELLDWDQSSFTDGQVATWNVTAGKFKGTTGGSTVERTYGFGQYGASTTGPLPIYRYVRDTCTATFLDVTCSSGTVTFSIEASTNGGSTWSTVDTLSVSSGISATKASSGTIVAGSVLRGNITAISGVSNVSIMLTAVK